MTRKFGSTWLIATCAHAIGLFLIFWLVFAELAGSFTESSAGKKADQISSFGAVLDYPVYLYKSHSTKLSKHPVTMSNYITERGPIDVGSLLWSPVFGLLIAIAYFVYGRFQKYKNSAEQGAAANP